MNRRETLLFELRKTLKQCGVNFIATKEERKYLVSFIIDYDDGTNYGDNIEITVPEFLEYCEKMKVEEESDVNPDMA